MVFSAHHYSYVVDASKTLLKEPAFNIGGRPCFTSCLAFTSSSFASTWLWLTVPLDKTKGLQKLYTKIVYSCYLCDPLWYSEIRAKINQCRIYCTQSTDNQCSDADEASDNIQLKAGGRSGNTAFVLRRNWRSNYSRSVTYRWWKKGCHSK